jgi:hypothetical protein
VTEAVWEAHMLDEQTRAQVAIRFVAWNVTDALDKAETRMPDHVVVGLLRL